MENSWRGSNPGSGIYAENPGREADTQQIGSRPMEHFIRARREACRFSPRLHSSFRAKYAVPKYEVRACIFCKCATAHLDELQPNLNDNDGCSGKTNE